MTRLILAFAALLLATPAAAQTLTLTNLKAPIARAAGKAEARSIAELWMQIRGLPAAEHDHAAAPDTGWELSPTLDGLAPIASGLAVAPLQGPSWGTGAIPGNELADVQGAFRFTCTPSHNAYDDPIVYPGQPGKSHLHTFFGNTKADGNSTYASLRTTGDSTCTNVLNRSAYWIAAMMHPSGKVVMPDWVSIYYKRAPKGSVYCSEPYARECRALPRDLRYIFGYNMIDPAKQDPAGARYFNCDGPGAKPGHYALIAEAGRNCPAGARLGAIISSPECWDGKHLDSPDHRAHMAFSQQDGYGRAVCPKTHPVRLATFQLGAWYPNDGTAAQWMLSSDIQMGTAGGTTFHADWWGAWEDSILARWTANCIDKALNCSGTDLGDGSQMRQVGPVNRSGPALVDPPAKPQPE